MNELFAIWTFHIGRDGSLTFLSGMYLTNFLFDSNYDSVFSG